MTTCVLTEVFALPLPYLTRDIAAALKQKSTGVLQVSGAEPTDHWIPPWLASASRAPSTRLLEFHAYENA